MTDWYRSEETMNSETIDGYFLNKLLTVWFTDFTKIFCNVMLKYIWMSPLGILIHY